MSRLLSPRDEPEVGRLWRHFVGNLARDRRCNEADCVSTYLRSNNRSHVTASIDHVNNSVREGSSLESEAVIRKDSVVLTPMYEDRRFLGNNAHAFAHGVNVIP